MPQVGFLSLRLYSGLLGLCIVHVRALSLRLDPLGLVYASGALSVFVLSSIDPLGLVYASGGLCLFNLSSTGPARACLCLGWAFCLRSFVDWTRSGLFMPQAGFLFDLLCSFFE